ncbi:amino acid permease [Leuconostoc mesenteroides]|uniref:amino acid permease n=1 Tax=Leuconostoc mesenteroides TaxID=1245 RepID=UPI00235F6AFE|nr:amino acid permease [Leuconostoc mesenteroides]
MTKTTLKRAMSARQIQMIGLASGIGTGLFLSSAYTIHTAGALGTILAYTIGAALVYLIMLSVAELSIAMPQTGAFHYHAQKLIGPATGFLVAISYWLTWTIALGSEFTASGIIMQRWFPHVPVWAFSGLFILIILLSNVFSVKIFGESEYWLAAIKVVAIIVFLFIGVSILTGIVHTNTKTPVGFQNIFSHGAFPNGIGAVFTTMLAVNFAFSGTELMGITAGEAVNPEKAIPKAIKAVWWRQVVFFIGSITILAAIIPYEKAGLTESPFVTVFSMVGVPYAADIMNFVILTGILSMANSGLYASTRMLWSLSHENLISPVFERTNRNGIPVAALIASLAGGLLALFSSFVAAGSLYLILVSISGLAVVFVWIAIAWSHFKYYRLLKKEDRINELRYPKWAYPALPLAGFIGSSLSVILVIFDPNQRDALIWSIPFVLGVYVYYYIRFKWWPKPQLVKTANSKIRQVVDK